MRHSDTVTLDGVTYEVDFDIEPAQYGGMEDPSWPAHSDDLVVTCGGESVEDEGVISEIEKVLDNKLVWGW